MHVEIDTDYVAIQDTTEYYDYQCLDTVVADSVVYDYTLCDSAY